MLHSMLSAGLPRPAGHAVEGAHLQLRQGLLRAQHFAGGVVHLVAGRGEHCGPSVPSCALSSCEDWDEGECCGQQNMQHGCPAAPGRRFAWLASCACSSAYLHAGRIWALPSTSGLLEGQRQSDTEQCCKRGAPPTFSLGAACTAGHA